jgi:hypothetical protein
MKKQLPTAAISSELAHSSVFFQKPTLDQPQEPVEQPVKEKPPKPHSLPEKRHSPPPSKSIPAIQKPAQEHLNRTTTPNERAVQPNGDTERSSVLSELEEGVRESKRPTERYSFEIYTDMKEKIEDIQYQYKKKTGKKLSASRIIREALEVYFAKLEEAI